jgi:hypothetical protein
MDVINLISKVPGLPDAPVTIPEDEYQEASAFFANGYVVLIPERYYPHRWIKSPCA